MNHMEPENPYFLVPEITQKSPSLTAVVCKPPTSLPANASLIAKQINFFPAKTSGTTWALISSEPKLMTGGRPITPPARKPSTYPRQPQRASSRFRINCPPSGEKPRVPSWPKLANLVEVIELLSPDNPAEQTSPLKVLAWPKSHREYVHFTGFHTVSCVLDH